MRRIVGELLLLLALWIEYVALKVGTTETAVSFARTHRHPTEEEW